MARRRKRREPETATITAVTHDGRTLALERAGYHGQDGDLLHLYQELCPISPLVASRLEPLEFCRFITDTRQSIHVPRIVFAELALDGLASDPVTGVADNLPYRYMEHLRDCLAEVYHQRKESKLVLKRMTDGVPYRLIRGGFYVGDASEFAFYRLPEEAALEQQHRDWWRSAQQQPLL